MAVAQHFLAIVEALIETFVVFHRVTTLFVGSTDCHTGQSGKFF
jgi:hypothetical protein